MSAVLHVVVAATDVDVAIDVLWSHGAVGVHTADVVDGVRLVTAFADDVDPTTVGHEMAARLPAAEVTVVDDDGTWWDAWRTHAVPTSVAGGRLVIVPAWQEPPPLAPGTVVVRIEPGRTFGSGAHATTRLALATLVDLEPELAGARVLDVGCGSGVLAVVAARLGAAHVMGVDVDPACASATEANAAANGLAGRVRATTGPLAELAGPFDVVVANVLPPVLEALAPEIDRLGRRWLVVTGMLTETTVDGTERALRAFPSWHLAERSSEDGWSAALLRRDRFLTGANEELRGTR